MKWLKAEETVFTVAETRDNETCWYKIAVDKTTRLMFWCSTVLLKWETITILLYAYGLGSAALFAA